MEEHKVVILGSGIAGMTAGIYLKRGGLDVLVVEDNIPGGVSVSYTHLTLPTNSRV